MTTTTQNTTNRIYPGLNCGNVEIFNNEGNVKAFYNGKLIDFENLPFLIIETLKENINKLPNAKAILEEWFPGSELQQIKKFASCRLGGLDFTPDIEHFQLQSGEYWDCPLRGKCKGEGIVCKKLMFLGNELEAFEIKMLKLITTSATNEAIAYELEMSMGQYHKLKKALYKKLGNIQTKQEATLVAVGLNLI